MYAIYGNIYHQYTPNVSIYTIYGSYGYSNGKFARICDINTIQGFCLQMLWIPKKLEDRYQLS